jgi:TPR repeat protein
VAPPPVPAALAAEGRASVAVSKIEASALIARGQSFLAQADIASAQLFFRLAADRGSGAAARAMAASVDPVALAANPIPGGRADPAEAVQWYQRAIALGDEEARAPLGRLVQQLRERAGRGDGEAAAALKRIE